MNTVLGVLFALHAFAHLAGLVGAFRLISTVPHQSTVLFGRLDLSEGAARAGGVAWLIAGLGFAIASAGAFVDAAWWPRLVVAAALASTSMCVLYLPETRLGLIINIAVLLAFVFGRAAFWWLIRD
jgi:hypothetical protein